MRLTALGTLSQPSRTTRTRHVTSRRAGTLPSRRASRAVPCRRQRNSHGRTDRSRCRTTSHGNHASARSRGAGHFTNGGNGAGRCRGMRKRAIGLTDFADTRTSPARRQHQLGHFSPYRVILIGWQRNGSQDTDDRNNDHQLDEGKALLGTALDALHVHVSYSLDCKSRTTRLKAQMQNPYQNLQRALATLDNCSKLTEKQGIPDKPQEDVLPPQQVNVIQIVT